MGLGEVAGYYSNLKKGFDDIGVKCTFVELNAHPFGYEGSTSNALIRAFQWFAMKWRASVNSHIAFRAFYRCGYHGTKALLFLWALLFHDVFLLGFGSSFYSSFWDLPLLRLARKRVIFTFFGSDARPPYLNGAIMASDRAVPINQLIEQTRKLNERLSTIERYASEIVAYPYDTYFFHRPVISFYSMGMPRDLTIPECAALRSLAPSVRILHAPSHPEGKGSPRIRQAIANLQAEGLDIDYVEITGKPNSDVMCEMAASDIIVDEVYACTCGSSILAEAALMGKPTIVGANNFAEILRVYAENTAIPMEPCHPDTLELTMKKLIVDAEYRRALGGRAREFVLAEWGAERVARRYMRFIEGDVPATWRFDPNDLDSIVSWGLPEDRLAHIIRELVSMGGVEALQLASKPRLERMVVDFAFGQVH